MYFESLRIFNRLAAENYMKKFKKNISLFVVIVLSITLIYNIICSSMTNISYSSLQRTDLQLSSFELPSGQATANNIPRSPNKLIKTTGSGSVINLISIFPLIKNRLLISIRPKSFSYFVRIKSFLLAHYPTDI